nr:hypothetical protein [Mycolicibacterium mengxianglii]
MSTDQKSSTGEVPTAEGDLDQIQTAELPADSDTETDDVAEPSEADEAESSVADGSSTSRRRASVTAGLAVLGVLLIAAASVTAWLYFAQYRPSQQTSPAAEQSALQAAREGTVALLSYAPDTLDADLSAAKSHLTGEFLTYYSQFTDQIVKPAATEKKVQTTANVVRAAVSEMQPNTATVLVFVNQTTMSTDRPDPTLANSSVLVHLTKVDGTWLISEFKPV